MYIQKKIQCHLSANIGVTQKGKKNHIGHNFYPTDTKFDTQEGLVKSKVKFEDVSLIEGEKLSSKILKT